MTNQIVDVIILNGRKFSLVGIPLSPWLTANKVTFEGQSTANYRGYAATWIIFDKNLYLDSCSSSHRHKKSAPTSLPCDHGMVLADWFSGTLVIPCRDLMPRANLNDGGSETTAASPAISIKIANGHVTSMAYKNYSGHLAPAIPDDKLIKPWAKPPQDLVDWLIHGDTPPENKAITNRKLLMSNTPDESLIRQQIKRVSKLELRPPGESDLVKSALAELVIPWYDPRQLYLVGDEIRLPDHSVTTIAKYDGHYFVIAKSKGRSLRLAHGILPYDENNFYGIGDVVETGRISIPEKKLKSKVPTLDVKSSTLISWIEIEAYLTKSVASGRAQDDTKKYMLHNVQSDSQPPTRTESLDNIARFDDYIQIDPTFPILQIGITAGLIPDTMRHAYFVETTLADGSISRRPTMRPQEAMAALKRVLNFINYVSLPNSYERRWEFIETFGNSLRSVLPQELMVWVTKRLSAVE
jgi:hypothetical protein